MSLLQHEIDAFTDSNPGEVVKKVRKDFFEVELKDLGSYRAAMLSMQAFGGMMAVRAAKRAFEEGTPPSYDFLLGQELGRATTIIRHIDAAHEASVNKGLQSTVVRMPEASAEFLVETMSETGRLAARNGDMLSYYADLMPTLLNEAGLSVDGSMYRYSI